MEADMRSTRSCCSVASFVLIFGVIFLAVASSAPVAAFPSHATASAAQARVQRASSEANLGVLEKQLILPSNVAARLAWARKALAPSGTKKLERLALATAPSIASGTPFAAIQKRTELDAIVEFAGLSGMDVSEAAFIVMAMATKDMDDDIRMIMAEIKAMTAAKQKLRDQIKQLNDWISQEMAKDRQELKTSDVEKARASGAKPSVAGKPQPARAALARGVTLEKAVSPVIHFEYAKAPAIPPLPPKNSGTTIQGLKSLLDELTSELDGMNEMSEMTSLRLQMTMDRRSKFISTLSQMMKKTSTTQDTLVQNIK
jgi:hypothetical protein